jgi:hypothetical protein
MNFFNIVPHHKKVYHKKLNLSSVIFSDEISGIIISRIEIMFLGSQNNSRLYIVEARLGGWHRSIWARQAQGSTIAF